MKKKTFTVTLTVDIEHVSDVESFDTYSIEDDLESLMMTDFPFVDFEVLESDNG